MLLGWRSARRGRSGEARRRRRADLLDTVQYRPGSRTTTTQQCECPLPRLLAAKKRRACRPAPRNASPRHLTWTSHRQHLFSGARPHEHGLGGHGQRPHLATPPRAAPARCEARRGIVLAPQHRLRLPLRPPTSSGARSSPRPSSPPPLLAPGQRCSNILPSESVCPPAARCHGPLLTHRSTGTLLSFRRHLLGFAPFRHVRRKTGKCPARQTLINSQIA